MKYELSEQLINAIAGYLSKQPYAEVAQLIMAIQAELQPQLQQQQQPEQQEQNE